MPILGSDNRRHCGQWVGVMAFRFAFLVAVLLSSTAEGTAAETLLPGSDFRERVSIDIDDAKAATAGLKPMVRPPAVSGVDDRHLPATAMPKILVAETGLFLAKASVTVVVRADGNQADCRSEGASIRRGDWSARGPETALALDVCDLLRQSVKFRHAIDVSGEPIDSSIRLSITFSRMNPVTVPPPVPVVLPVRTSGHVIGDNERWIDGSWWAGRFAVQNPDWSVAFSNRRETPKEASVGVMLTLAAKMGYGYIDACKVELSSGDAQLDAATCKALTASSYREGSANRVYNSTDSYPVLVRWNRGTATMAAPALPMVPHMPEDVPLTTMDIPSGTMPALRAIPMNVSLDSDGHANGCEVTRSSGNDTWDAAGCRIALERARFTAVRDWFGRPARGLYEAVADWDAKAIRPAH